MHFLLSSFVFFSSAAEDEVEQTAEGGWVVGVTTDPTVPPWPVAFGDGSAPGRTSGEQQPQCG